MTWKQLFSDRANLKTIFEIIFALIFAGAFSFILGTFIKAI